MLKLFFALGLLLAPFSSHALFEARVGYGTMTPDEDTYAGSELDKLQGFNLDLIFEPPLITDMGFGVRYEKLSMDIGTSAEADLERLSALVNYRFIDLITYFGLIGTVGISNDLSVEVGGATDDTYDPKVNFSLGLEGGISLGLIQVGAEIGKFFGKADHATNGELDMSGIYGKVLVGVGF